MSNVKVETLLKREAERQQEILRKKTNQQSTTAENEKYTYFETVFEEKRKEIQDLLETTNKENFNKDFDKMYKNLNALKKFISESIIFLRNYDIRVYHEQLQELESQIKKTEEILVPKKKFGFKNKNTTKTVKEVSKDTVDSCFKPTKNYETNFFGYKNLNNKNLTLNDITLKDVTLQNLSNCTINLSGVPSTLQMSSLNNCTINSGPVSTSIFAENCYDCKLIIACQQLRLHSSINCQIYLHVTSKAIIEDCSGIKVAPFNNFYDGYVEDFKIAGLDLNVNNWDKLDDFNWLVADKVSPNWSILDENDRILDWSYLHE